MPFMAKKQSASKKFSKRNQKGPAVQAKQAVADPNAVNALEKAAAAIRGVLDASPRPPSPPAPLIAPGVSLPSDQFPSVEQIAHLAALIGQGQKTELQSLVHVLPDDHCSEINACSLENGHQAAARLANAALMLWRAANDVRFLWMEDPDMQINYQLYMRSRLPMREDWSARFHGILAKLKVKREEQDKATWPWDEAERLIFQGNSAGQDECRLPDLVENVLLKPGHSYASRTVEDFRQKGIPFDAFADLLFATEEMRKEVMRQKGAKGGKKSAQTRAQNAKKKRGRLPPNSM